jgi:hypothetical protein
VRLLQSLTFRGRKLLASLATDVFPGFIDIGKRFARPDRRQPYPYSAQHVRGKKALAPDQGSDTIERLFKIVCVFNRHCLE